MVLLSFLSLRCFLQYCQHCSVVDPKSSQSRLTYSPWSWWNHKNCHDQLQLLYGRNATQMCLAKYGDNNLHTLNFWTPQCMNYRVFVRVWVKQLMGTVFWSVNWELLGQSQTKAVSLTGKKLICKSMIKVRVRPVVGPVCVCVCARVCGYFVTHITSESKPKVKLC